MFNQYIASVKNDECMDCGTKDIKVLKDEKDRPFKQCQRCGKEYFISQETFDELSNKQINKTSL